MTYLVTITRTRTIEMTTEIEVIAKDEEKAIEKAEKKMDGASIAGKLNDFDWNECSDDDSFEYNADEA